jgi:hypothetical protein
MAAVRSFVLSTPPETTKKRQTCVGSGSKPGKADTTPTKGVKTGNEEDVEMGETRGSSDGWETQESACDEQGGRNFLKY